MERIYFLRYHFCKDIKNVKSISVKQYRTPGKDRWYYNLSGEMYEIKYCPHCGVKLPKK